MWTSCEANLTFLLQMRYVRVEVGNGLEVAAGKAMSPVEIPYDADLGHELLSVPSWESDASSHKGNRVPFGKKQNSVAEEVQRAADRPNEDHVTLR